MTYELWDQGSGNRIDGFGTFARLLQVVREIAEVSGLEAVDDLLVEIWPAGEAPSPSVIIRGTDLRQLTQPLVRTYRTQIEGRAVSATTSTAQSMVVSDLAVAV